MSDKSTADGEPQVLWLQDLLDAKLGAGTTTVICPIADAFVAHHGALGGFVRVWSRGAVTARQIIGAGRRMPKAWSWRWTATPPAACSTCRRTAKAMWRWSPKSTWCIGSSAKNHDLRRPEGPPPAHAWRHLGDQGAVHPESAIEQGLPVEGGGPVGRRAGRSSTTRSTGLSSHGAQRRRKAKATSIPRRERAPGRLSTGPAEPRLLARRRPPFLSQRCPRPAWRRGPGRGSGSRTCPAGATWISMATTCTTWAMASRGHRRGEAQMDSCVSPAPFHQLPRGAG